MSIEKQLSTDKQQITLYINGDFNFNVYNEFRAAYSEVDPQVKFILDLNKTTAMDSSALGMLLNMKKKLNKADGEIQIINASDTIKRVMQLANMNQQFTINL